MMKRGLVFMSLGFELVGLIFGALYVGQVVDNQMHWNGYGVAIFVVAVMIGWMYHLYVLLKKFMAEAERDYNDKNKPDPN